MLVKRFKHTREKVALHGAPAAREFGACVCTLMDRWLGENDLSGGGKGNYIYWRGSFVLYIPMRGFRSFEPQCLGEYRFCGVENVGMGELGRDWR